MKNLIKKMAVALIISCMAINVYAQTEDETDSIPFLGITNSDVQNFAKNHEKIVDALDKFGFDLEERNNEIDTYAEAIAINEEAEAIIEKYGISGPNNIQKIYIISWGYSIDAYDRELDKDPASKALLQAMGMADPMIGLRSLVHPDDFEVIHKNYKYLAAAFGEDSSENDVKENKPSKSTSTGSSNSSKSNKYEEDDDEDVDDFDSDDLKNYLKGKIKEKAKKEVKKTIDSWF